MDHKFTECILECFVLESIRRKKPKLLIVGFPQYFKCLKTLNELKGNVCMCVRSVMSDSWWPYGL